MNNQTKPAVIIAVALLVSSIILTIGLTSLGNSIVKAGKHAKPTFQVPSTIAIKNPGDPGKYPFIIEQKD